MPSRPSPNAACALLFVGLAAFWAGIGAAAQSFPVAFDWQYMPVSDLFSPRRNPAAHGLAASGLAVAGVLVAAWAATARPGHAPRSGLLAMQAGAACMAVLAVLPETLVRGSKIHEMLALVAFTSLCLGIVNLSNRAVRQALANGRGMAAGQSQVLAKLIAALAVLPILCAGAAQLYVYYALPGLHWVNRSWRARGVPVYLSFAFWEWITCAMLSLYLALLAVATRCRTAPPDCGV